MSASMASTGKPAAERCRLISALNVVLPLPPFPTNAIFISKIMFSLAPLTEAEELKGMVQDPERRSSGNLTLVGLEVFFHGDVFDALALNTQKVMMVPFVRKLI